MPNTPTVHSPRRIARGVRMDAELWDFLDALAVIRADGSTSALLESMVRELQRSLKAGS